LSKEHKNDWNIYIDADALVHPDFPDVTTVVNKDTVLFHAKDFSTQRFRADEYVLRDGRHIGEGNWFSVSSDWCRDVWHPLDDITFEEACENIFPTVHETNTVIKRNHLIDDYLVSRNIARYGLKHALMQDIWPKFGKAPLICDARGLPLLWHEYTVPIEKKEVSMKQTLKMWGVTL